MQQDTSNDIPESDEEGEELSYGELLANAILNGEIIITIPMEEEERVKNGIKNFKSKQATKAKEDGQPVDSAVLVFSSVISTEFPGCVDLSIQSKSRGTVRIKKLRIPENDF